MALCLLMVKLRLRRKRLFRHTYVSDSYDIHSTVVCAVKLADYGITATPIV